MRGGPHLEGHRILHWPFSTNEFLALCSLSIGIPVDKLVLGQMSGSWADHKGVPVGLEQRSLVLWILSGKDHTGSKQKTMQQSHFNMAQKVQRQMVWDGKGMGWEREAGSGWNGWRKQRGTLSHLPNGTLVLKALWKYRPIGHNSWRSAWRAGLWGPILLGFYWRGWTGLSASP